MFIEGSYTMEALFEQLGLKSDADAIDAFIKTHQLPEGCALSEASFWNDAQRHFICEEMVEDADWTPVVDELNMLLHADAHTT
ncbi:DUF2789 domain-containing protein [Granulosicoccaceae sp. 1_MG-2023]|nr:DUF2789 domain-containing protein [Granulosicoccaceae sp. 1_MG-2023]